jgi:hypothetical protein
MVLGQSSVKLVLVVRSDHRILLMQKETLVEKVIELIDIGNTQILIFEFE